MRYPTLARTGFVMPSRFQNSNSYEGAGTGRRAAGWTAPDSGPNVALQSGLRTLRNRSRAAARNDPYAGNAIDRRVSSEIGTGIVPRPRHRDGQIRALLQEVWDDWVEEADADDRADFYGMTALVSRSVNKDGEVFARFRTRRLDDGFVVPLQLQLLAAEFVPHEKNEVRPNGNVIRCGIEFNPIGQRVAYWMYRSHPGESGATARFNELVRVPADQVLHIYEQLDPGQLRGVPILGPVLLRLRSLDNFDDAVLFRQEVANLFAGFIKRPPPTGPAALDPTTGKPYTYDSDGFTPLAVLEPGTMQELAPGEEVEFSEPPDSGNSYPDFMRQQLQAAAAGVGLPYELFTGDMRNVNDRVLRVVLNEFRRRIEQRQFAVYVHQWCRPTRAAWLDTAVASGAVKLPNYATQRRAYLRTRWVPQGWAYIHPVQDVQAQQMEVRSGFASRAEVCLRRGYDAEQIDEENAADREREQSLGLSYDTNPFPPLDLLKDDTP